MSMPMTISSCMRRASPAGARGGRAQVKILSCPTRRATRRAGSAGGRPGAGPRPQGRKLRALVLGRARPPEGADRCPGSSPRRGAAVEWLVAPGGLMPRCRPAGAHRAAQPGPARSKRSMAGRRSWGCLALRCVPLSVRGAALGCVPSRRGWVGLAEAWRMARTASCPARGGTRGAAKAAACGGSRPIPTAGGWPACRGAGRRGSWRASARR